MQAGADGTVTHGDPRDMAEMVGALRVVQKLHDEGRLAPGWSVTDATLIYWATTSPKIRETLGSVGMSDENYLAAMRRLFTNGLLGRANLPTPKEETELDDGH